MAKQFLITLTLCLLALFFVPFQFVAGQSLDPQLPGGCGTDLLLEKQLTDPMISRKLESLERDIARQLATGETQQLRSSAACTPGQITYRIPVVVHLVHATTSGLGTGANLTDATVINTINQVNARFAHGSGLAFANPFSGTDAGIELVLATRDPMGNPTNGILRYPDDVNTINVYGTSNTQNAYNWPTADYFNLYIVETICDAGDCPNNNGVGGFAFFPSSSGQTFDGAVFRADIYWSGLIAHEAGHYFGLYHTFQGGCPNNDCSADGDRVCDTPPKGASGYGTGSCAAPGDDCNTDDDDLSVANPFRPVGAGGMGNQNDGLENYMDYSAACWEAFTAGQGARMRAAIETGRPGLLTSLGAVPFSPNDAGISAIDFPVDGICSSPFTPQVTLENFGTNPMTTCVIDVELNGVLVQTFNWAGNIAPGASLAVSLNPVVAPIGTHLLYVNARNPNGAADGYAVNDATCIEFDFAAPINTYPYSEGFEAALFPPNNFSLHNPDADYSWERTTTVGGFGASTASMMFDNFNNNETGTVDELRTPILNFSGLTSILLSFDVAYAPYSAANSDGLEVYYSVDCGVSWNQVYAKVGSILGTAPSTTSLFVPTAAQWRTETVSLTGAGLNGAPSVQLAFRNLPDFGNVLYLDNINLDAISPLDGQEFLLLGEGRENRNELSWRFEGDKEISQFEVEKFNGVDYTALAKIGTGDRRQENLQYTDWNPGAGDQIYRVKGTDLNGSVHFSNQVLIHGLDNGIKVFPNPFEDVLNLSGFEPASLEKISLYDLHGKKVWEEEGLIESGGNLTLRLGDIPTGIYVLRVFAGGGVSLFKVLKD